MTHDAETIIVDGVEGYPSLMALRDAHGALLNQRRAGGDSADLLTTAETFIQRGMVTGAVLDSNEDRRAAQSLLNYWANALYRADREPLDATLAEFDPLLAPELPDALCPYLGLDPFSETSAERFFGRQELISRMLERLNEQRLLAVVGPSGSGKSSVVRAGLLPALRHGALPGSETWRYLPPIVPGSDPLASLKRVHALDQSVSSREQEWSVIELDGSPDHVILPPTLLIVDQFEEVFTLCEDRANRQAFITELLALASISEPPHRVILTMRSDFETFVARIPEFQPIFERGRVQVTPLSAAELREAIEAPAALVGLKFEQGIVDLLLQDILGEPAGLPLLQFTLLKLWEQRERNRVTRAAYERVGGGRLALARSADAFYQRLIPEEQVTARRMLLRMVRPSEGLEITSSRVRRTALLQGGEDPGRVERVLGRLIDAHLVRLTAGETPDDDQIEVAHEALVRNWPTLVTWLEQENAAIAIRRRLESRAAEWTRLGRGDTGLLDEVEWREAERWLQSAEAQYLGYEQALPNFIAASRTTTERATREKEAAHQRELDQRQALVSAQAKAREARWLLGMAIILAMLLLLAIVAARYAFIQRNIAQTAQAQAQREAANARTAEAVAQLQRNIAQTAEVDTQAQKNRIQALQIDQARQAKTAELLALAARAESQLDPELGLLLAIEAAKPIQEGQVEDVNGQIEQVLRQTIGNSHVRSVFSMDNNPITSANFSHNGKLVAVSAGNTVKLWNLNTGDIKVLKGHTGRIITVVFSHNDRLIVTASEDATSRIWDTNTGESRGLPLLHWYTISSAIFSHDDEMVATASNDSTVTIWNTNTSEEIRTLAGHSDIVTSVDFSFDDRLIVTGSRDGTARIWNIDTGENPISVRHDGQIDKVLFSPQGSSISTASWDQTAGLWDVSTGAKQLTVQGYNAQVICAVFSPNSQYLAVASWDGTAQVRDIRLGETEHLSFLIGHLGKIYSAMFDPTNQLVVTSGADHTARIWQASTGKEILLLRGHTAPVTNAMFSPDGKSVLTASDDGTARIWEVSISQNPLPENIHELLALAHTRVTRELTLEERQKFVDDLVPPLPTSVTP